MCYPAYNTYFRRDPTVTEANALKDTGVKMIAVGITDLIDKELLQIMSSPPQLEGRNFFTATDFTSLVDIQTQVAVETCQVVSASKSHDYVVK